MTNCKSNIAIMLGVAGLSIVNATAATTDKLLYEFRGHAVRDGAVPNNMLLYDPQGAFYGTTGGGGIGTCGLSELPSYGCGTVFQLTKSGSTWQETTIYRFKGGVDQCPSGSLISDRAGNLYGVTEGATVFGCGAPGNGTVYRLSQTADGKWTQTIIYSFAGGEDGSSPTGGLTFDDGGQLYGTTTFGGGGCGFEGCGTVFQLTLSKDIWTHTVLYRFNAFDGQGPEYSSLVFDHAGHLYGTTAFGGSHNWGNVFVLEELNGTWKETDLYDFADGSDGALPIGNLSFDTAGNLYGTTNQGEGVDCGTVFELMRPQMPNTFYGFRLLHAFHGSDGCSPFDGLTFDVAGNAYGTTFSGGSNNNGTVFMLTPKPTGEWSERVIHNFNPEGDVATDGYSPTAGVTFDGSGHLYGVTPSGGTLDIGVFYQLQP